jgi:hypothetical protein
LLGAKAEFLNSVMEIEMEFSNNVVGIETKFSNSEAETKLSNKIEGAIHSEKWDGDGIIKKCSGI